MRSDGDGGQVFVDALIAAQHGDTAGLSVLYREFHRVCCAISALATVNWPTTLRVKPGSRLLSESQHSTETDPHSRRGCSPSLDIVWPTLAARRVVDGRTPWRTYPKCERTPAEQTALDNLSAQAAVDRIARRPEQRSGRGDHAESSGGSQHRPSRSVMGRDVVWVGVTQHRALERLANRFRSEMLVVK